MLPAETERGTIRWNWKPMVCEWKTLVVIDNWSQTLCCATEQNGKLVKPVATFLSEVKLWKMLNIQ